MFKSKSAISSTSTVIVPTFTALILFSFTMHSEYSVVYAPSSRGTRRSPGGSPVPESRWTNQSQPYCPPPVRAAAAKYSSPLSVLAATLRRLARMPGSEGAVEARGVQVCSVLLLRVLVRHVSVRPRGGRRSLARNLLRDEASTARGGVDAPGRSRSAELRRGGGFRDRFGEFGVGMRKNLCFHFKLLCHCILGSRIFNLQRFLFFSSIPFGFCLHFLFAS
ncbi:hypothetical protein Fmac_014690 [Flemingia macrophylla]|uniref:Uncharacterized protein n=1 Tax=Flemingia macrophylla TaxID=520843 RepID=A0ABD1MCG5_9FABA